MLTSLLTDLFSTTETASTAISIGSSLIAIAFAMIIGLLVGLTYMKAARGAYSSTLIFTLIILPSIVAMIIIMVGSNVARAFSMAGVFSLIRFRSTAGDPKDICYIFLASAVGLAAGLGYIAQAFLMTVAICIVMLILGLVRFGEKKATSMRLKITVPEDLDFKGAFDEILEQYTDNYKMEKIRTSDLGTVFELSYTVGLKSDCNEKEFMDKLRVRNGNMDIILNLREDQGGSSF